MWLSRWVLFYSVGMSLTPQIYILITFSSSIRTPKMNECESNHLIFFLRCLGHSAVLPFHITFRIILYVTIKYLVAKCFEPISSWSLDFTSVLPSNKWLWCTFSYCAIRFLSPAFHRFHWQNPANVLGH